MLPLNYPVETLGSKEFTALPELLMEEVYTEWEYPVSFLGVYFKGSMLQVDYKNEKSTVWLMELGPKLVSYKGPVHAQHYIVPPQMCKQAIRVFSRARQK